MSILKFVAPAEIGLDPARWERACGLVTKWCETGLIPSAGICVGRRGQVVAPRLFGHQRVAGRDAIQPDAIFLIASITKPIVCAAVMMLIERGELSLSDRVIDVIPEFGKNGKNGVTVRHLMTHTSGLPDMVANNVELRRSHAPMSEFVQAIYGESLAFSPGKGVSYQSTGIAILGELILRLTGQTCQSFCHQEIFKPLGMLDTQMGAPAGWFEGANPTARRIAEIRVPEDQISNDWNWNSRYWRMLGAPWGGLLTTPADLAKYCLMMLNSGRGPTTQVLSPASVVASTCNQLEFMPDVPEMDRRCRPWGLGWRLNWPAHSANFGDFLGPKTYGHWGATGTVLWLDPDRDAFCIILTTQPQEPNGSYLSRLSNAISAACFL